MPDQEEINGQQELLATHRRTLAHYLEQQAQLGVGHTPPAVAQGIHDARDQIRRIKRVLHGWRVRVVDHPDDASPGATIDETAASNADVPDPPFENATLHYDAASFAAGPPVIHPRYFFGRERELRRLFNLWKGHPLQNAAIIGQRRSGKTSLLRYLQRITITPPEQLRPGQRNDWLLVPQRYRWIFVDFQDPRLGHCDTLLRYILKCMGLPAAGVVDLERFMDVVAGHLRTPTIILLDEVDVALERYQELDNAFWEGLRALATNQVGGNLAFVLATHEPPDRFAQHTGHSSPFFNIFGYTTTLGPLTEAEALALVGSSLLPFPDADVEWILNQSGRWPILLNILCRERLAALEDGEDGEAWREEGLRQLAPFRHLVG
jgi:hypothetical protein